MIQFEHVTKSYGKTPILKDLSFTIPDGQFVVLIGPSGCGKTTTLKTINRLIDIDSTAQLQRIFAYDRDHRCLSYFSSFGTTQMFWATVMLGNRPICWMT